MKAFKFNIFSNDSLAVFNHGSAYSVNLKSKEIKEIDIGSKTDIIDASFLNENELEITFYTTEKRGHYIDRKELKKTLHNII